MQVTNESFNFHDMKIIVFLLCEAFSSKTVSRNCGKIQSEKWSLELQQSNGDAKSVN